MIVNKSGSQVISETFLGKIGYKYQVKWFVVKQSMELIKAFKSMRNYLENHGLVDSNIYIPPCFFIFL